MPVLRELDIEGLWGASWSLIAGDGTGDGDGDGDGDGAGDGDGDGNHGGSRLGNWSPLIGIVTAIVGNVLIALALNVQRYAHIQLHRRRNEARARAREALERARNTNTTSRASYGTAERPSVSMDAQGDDHDDDNAQESHPLAQSFQSSDTAWTENESDDSKVTSTYLKSPSWWLGQVLMTVGEMGNFLAYGFAPASIVSPLGVFALISNCVIAPLFFGERFRTRDLWGVIIAVAGAIVVVLSANQEETKLDPHDIWDAITGTPFEVYVGVTCFFILVLMWASPRYGHRTILIDLGLVGLFGGYTVLSTKGVSSMLSSTLFKAFTTPVTYGLLLVLLGTAIMQVRYVNKALQRFDSTQVIPIQFVLFTLSVIIGSAVLYRDFERTTRTQATKFVGGCLLTFFGVFLITSGRPSHDDEDELSDDENIEESIGLMYREAAAAAAGTSDHPRDESRQQGQHPTSITSSRRSSLGSRISFASSTIKHLPPNRDARISRTSLVTPAEQSPLLNNPWTHSSSTDHLPSHPVLPQTLSNDSVVTIQSMPSLAATEPGLVSYDHDDPDGPPPGRPTTPPRHSISESRPLSRHFSSRFISPSPLSSTVNAMVSDALSGRGREGSISRRGSTRRMRNSLIASLGIPRDEDGADNLADPLSSSHGGGEPQADDEDEDETAEHKKSIRRRARSLSNTLEEFFGGKKKRRRNTDTESRTAGDRTPNSINSEGSLPG